jgi:hypothetical protein
MAGWLCLERICDGLAGLHQRHRRPPRPAGFRAAVRTFRAAAEKLFHPFRRHAGPGRRPGAGDIADGVAQGGAVRSRRAQVSTWIFTIARNLRTDARRKERDPQTVAEFFDRAADPLPSEHLLSAERDALVRRALTQLPAEQAEALRLSFYEDRPHSEIAGLLGLPLGTVKSRVRLAMARLRTLVEDKQ